MQANEVRETPSGGGTVLVSGATGGIGTALVEALIRKGRPVVALGRDADRLAELSDEQPLVRPLRVDLRHPESLAESVAGLPELAELDAFVHCAGVSPVVSVAESPVELWREVLAVNLVSAAELTRLMLPALRASGGHVVLVNASPGLHAVPRWSAFAASKAGLSELAGSLRQEEGPNGVRVTSVHPGGTATELLREVRGAFGRDYDPAECIQPATLARAVVDALDLPRDAQITELHLRPSP
ncbi:SDR family oxidoreductase [Nocardiopsis metallicus]|uniref:NADP-dependent 3-hydroxy acid dehydrogenase YdfG n=1 Tax=Nocardiopsis metallicus TaxID=179819 RepID=A0A840WJT9_9ACTN|nr:SDR family oxidoreductase [Nocardiopsis metallicus]MBB5490348.1 NADP-dependent 3-hydroxy acid dehydrogenase YdfG [Nocardiopsis metallicus]